ncbi:MAG: hypothetical protein KA524_07710 [Nitrosomonas sp.]|nr:hypothetical protein [Nitrosomonas sp.]MBP6076003.1 hypothetical protein [Nitrosomonas sp.]
MKAMKFSALIPLFALSLLASPVVADNDHEALVKHYGNLVEEAKVRLQENRRILEEYEDHPYYYGRQGQDVRSHASANIREYEKTLKENLANVDLHRRMAVAQRNDQTNKTEVGLNRDFTAANPEYSDSRGL